MILNSKSRFSDRVENYVKYRPHYPKEVIDYLKTHGVLKDDSIIADIGSGTGISSELFLENGNTVYGVEPNAEMREAAENIFKDSPKFISLNATAEDTTLKDSSIDLIIAGQAFHWFDVEKTKIEFKRILKPERNVVLIWNKRKRGDSPFQEEYENLLLKYGTDYKEVGHQNIGKEGLNILFDGKFEQVNFDNKQVFDFEGFKGRLLSSSYAPNEGQANYQPMLEDLKNIFDKYKKNGAISFEYATEVYAGKP
jgi:SAM-dependent methyltransferase